MTRLFLILAIISASFCSLNAQNRKTPTGKTEEGPAAVLSYTKSVADISEVYLNALLNVDTVLMKAVDNIRLVQRKTVEKPDLIDCSAMKFDKQTIAQYQSKIKSGPEFPEKNMIIENVEQGMFYYDKIVVNCNDISSYFSKELYKDDKGGYKKYLGLIDSLYKNLKNVHIGWSRVSMLLEMVQEKTNMEILQNSNIGEFAIPMNRDLKALDEMFKMYSQEFVDLNTITYYANALQNSISLNQNIYGKDWSKLSKPSYKDIYESFYNNLKTGLLLIKIALEKKSAVTSDMLIVPNVGMNPEDNGNAVIEKVISSIDVEGMEEDYAKAREAYRSASEEYNEFVKQ